MDIQFEMTTGGMQLLATFISRLLHEGVTFKIHQQLHNGTIQVELQGN